MAGGNVHHTYMAVGSEEEEEEAEQQWHDNAAAAVRVVVVGWADISATNSAHCWQYTAICHPLLMLTDSIDWAADCLWYAATAAAAALLLTILGLMAVMVVRQPV